MRDDEFVRKVSVSTFLLYISRLKAKINPLLYKVECELGRACRVTGTPVSVKSRL